MEPMQTILQTRRQQQVHLPGENEIERSRHAVNIDAHTGTRKHRRQQTIA
jgi:hypothetical protein